MLAMQKCRQILFDMDLIYFDDLRDIHGLDSIPWWPLASGYWLILFALIVVFLLVRTWLRRYDWRVDARQAFFRLKHQHNRLTHKELVAEFSELLRRVAMARYGREACAGLHGQAWLKWLEAHDPKAFPWTDAGKTLLTLPYAPSDVNVAVNTEYMSALFRALRCWIDEDLPQTKARKAHFRVWWQATWQRLWQKRQARKA